MRAVLPGFVVEHWPDILLLDHRFDCERDQMWSAVIYLLGGPGGRRPPENIQLIS